MGSEENGDRVFQQRVDKSILIYPFYGSNNWDPIVSLSQSEDFMNEFANPHCSVVLENQTVETSSHSVHFPSDSSLVDLVPEKISCFGSSFGDIAELKNGVGNQRALTNIADSQERGQNSKDGILGPSPYGKRKRSVSVGASPKNVEEKQKDPSGDTSKLPKKDEENKQKSEQNTSIGAEPCKENYIHVRAKRGQATNSHSLAERVRRERISERMRLLQELVPGCNKITGKAMMLDEIINYVQSLQQQVEFLSLKLATVNPELNVDLDRICSKDILHLRGINPAALGIASGLSSSHPFPGYPQGTFNGAQGTTPPFHPSLPQHIWNNELQGILQMGFDHDPSVNSLEPNGLSKLEL